MLMDGSHLLGETVRLPRSKVFNMRTANPEGVLSARCFIPWVFALFVFAGINSVYGQALPSADSMAAPESGSDLRVVDPRCEYRATPRGIDTPCPRLSWRLESDQRGQKQTAYQILAASKPDLLLNNLGDLWDSGKQTSTETTQIAYAGKTLVSGMDCFWKIRAWDTNDKPSRWSETTSWSMGLLSPDDWHADWIRCNPKTVQATETFFPSPWLRKDFVLSELPTSGRVYVNAVGYFELYVNGCRVGTDVLSPAVSDYRTRSFYVVYDITPLIHRGRNCIGLWLGRGWRVHGRPGVAEAGPIARLQAEIIAAGDRVRVVTDRTWRCKPSSYATIGPWRWDQFGGERYDARLDIPSWSSPKYDDTDWQPAEVIAPPVNCSHSQMCPLNRVGKSIPVARCTDLGKNRYELDFGTNLAGWLHITMPQLSAGQKVSIHYADRRYASAAPEAMPAGVVRHVSDETFATDHGNVRYQTFHQVDEFISAGRPHEEFCSKFNYHGFRYAIIDGLPQMPNAENVEALLVESDLETIGSFSCSNERLNRIHRLTLWTLRCLNLGGYMVDCPHREREGYGDGQVSAESCLMNWWMPNLYTKWLADWRDGQDPQTGAMPNMAPSSAGGGGPGWAGTLPSLAWRMHLYYGDRRLLEAYYDAIRKYVDFIEGRCRNGILRAYGGPWDFLGDWLPPGRGMDTSNWPSVRANEFFNNCYRVYLWELRENAASAIGREDEVQHCRATLDRIRPLIHKEFYDAGKRTYVLDEQPYQCFPLLVSITPSSERNALLQNLENNITIRRQGHLDSGMLGTYFLIRYLSTIRRDDLLFTIVNQDTYPGWGHMLEQGATTIWEQWNGYYSQIHSCFTSVAGWFHQGLGGIQPDPSAPGFKRFVIRPAVVGDLTWVKCAYQSAYGVILSNWSLDGSAFRLEVRIPTNTTATVYVPTSARDSVLESNRVAANSPGVRFLRMETGCAVFRVESGRYSFASTFQRSSLPRRTGESITVAFPKRTVPFSSNETRDRPPPISSPLLR